MGSKTIKIVGVANFKACVVRPVSVWMVGELWEADARKYGRLIFIHLQCWEVLPFCCFQRQRCIKILCPKDPDFYTPLVLKMAKGQHLPALVVYKNQSPKISNKGAEANASYLWPEGRNPRVGTPSGVIRENGAS